MKILSIDDISQRINILWRSLRKRADDPLSITVTWQSGWIRMETPCRQLYVELIDSAFSDAELNYAVNFLYDRVPVIAQFTD